MNEQFLMFLNREVNVVNANVLIGREQANTGTEFITITSCDNEEPIYSFWNKHTRKPSTNPKHTGGKPAYIKLYIKKVLKNNIDYDLIGVCFKLSAYMRWDAEYLEIGKGRRRRYIASDDIAKILNVSRATTFRLLKRMRASGLIDHDSTGYKLTGGYFVKGVQKNEG